MQYKLVEYHYTYVAHPIPGNIHVPIQLAPTICNQIIHHNAMHDICFVSCFLACRLQPQDLFLLPGATTLWTYTWSTQKAPTPRLIPYPGAIIHWCQELQPSNLFLRPEATTFWTPLSPPIEAPTPRARFIIHEATTPGLVCKVKSYNFLNPLSPPIEAPTPRAHSLPVGYNPMTCFWCQELQPSGLTLVPPIEAPTPMARSSYMTSYASAPTLCVLSVHAISHTTLQNSCFS
jgi:hypothetical protein